MASSAPSRGHPSSEKGELELTIISVFNRCITQETAATAIEYAFIAGLISIAAVVAFNTIGTNLSSTFSTVASSF